jgi:hypothetical protein
MKSQQRCCQGLIASSCSQRQIVEAEASVTPRSLQDAVGYAALLTDVSAEPRPASGQRDRVNSKLIPR